MTKTTPLDVEAMIAEDNMKVGSAFYIGGDARCEPLGWMLDVVSKDDAYLELQGDGVNLDDG